MIKQFILFSLLGTCLSAEIKFIDIESKPSGRAKNFMIWQYLKQDVTAKEADTAYALVEGNIRKINKAYLKKSTNNSLMEKIKCRNRQDLLAISEKDCFKLAMNPWKTLKMDAASREKLINKLESKAARDTVRIQAEPYTEKAYINYDANIILGMFLNINRKDRINKLNLKLSKEFITYVFSQKASNWKTFALIKKVVNDDKLHNLQKSLLVLDGQHVGSDSNFLLGLNHLRNGTSKRSVEHFELARTKSKKQMDKDKNIFWMYQATQNDKYLKDLSLSPKINIYTQYAKEKLDLSVENYFSAVELTDKTYTQNICDPFVWNDIQKEIKNTPQEKLFELAEKYKHKDMASVQSFIVEKAHKFKKHGYIMPYDEHLKDLSIDDKALVYALMRQESQLIPSALSRSFALGLMQLMPFVTDDLSTRMKNPVTCYNDMFIPKNNIKYAIKHLKWLKETFYHPLFIAYSYNGGMGYFRRHLKAKTFSKGKYEPFLSMELMSNRESREYGKIVLSNYVMYKKILGEEISISSLLSTLTNPKKTDRYRSQGLL